jgi:predicted alpha-1,2-mannosidase
MMRKYVYFCYISLICSCADNSEPFSLVDPFIGTGAHGHTFPGATAPFGMIQISPDTRLDGWDACSGYHYSDSIIYGFSHTHLSGTGVSDYGDFLLTPQSESLFLNKGNDSTDGYRQAFDHANEKAGPGWYSVKLDKGIEVQVRSGTRSGMYRFKFPKQRKFLSLDLNHRDELLDHWIEIRDEKTILAYRRSSAWARDQRIYFVAKFNKPIQKLYSKKGEFKINPGQRINSKVLGMEFDRETGNELEVFVAISAVDSKGPLKNLEVEQGTLNFSQFSNFSKALWEKEFSKIQVSGGSKEDRIKFFTAFYHSLIAPNTYSDIDDRYRGRDMEIHKGDQNYYTVFSLWDTYRALHPLLTIIDSSRTVEMVNTLIKQYEQGGTLPVWELSANETMCMIGYHAVPVIVDAILKGNGGIDKKKALEACIHSSNLSHLGLPFFNSIGFIPAGKEPESVSKSLEYAYDDWCISRLAKFIGEDSIFLEYSQRSQYWKNLFDPETRFFRAKINNGFMEPFIPSEVNFHYTEANAWHYSMYVPHAIEEWRNLLGGPAKLEKFLDDLFDASEETAGRNQADITGLIGQYAHGNEPSQHMAYLYNYTGSPWKTQKMARQILNDLYKTGPEGLPGNEDCGQMSAWFIMSSLGFYPVCPGSNTYELGSPLFDYSRIMTGGNKFFEIVAHDNSEHNIFIQSAKLNGEQFSRSFLKHDEISRGGKLEFWMGAEPSSWAVDGSFEMEKVQSPITAVPFLKRDLRSFKESAMIEIGHFDERAKIQYSINGGAFKEYVQAFNFRESTDLKMFAEISGKRSPEIFSRFLKIPGNRTIKILHPYANQYSAGGNDALIDGIVGGPNFSTGDWQGFQVVNLEAIVDLGSEQVINKVSVGFIQDWNSWIFFPKQVQFYASTDSLNWDMKGVYFNLIDPKEPGSILQDFSYKRPFSARYIKILAINRGKNPSWHRAPGDSCWIFADEIRIE